MGRFERHLFVCTNQRDPTDERGCCNPDGSDALHRRFKQRIVELGLKGRVRANSAGCLDQCAQGPSVVVYPEGIWYGGVTLDDVDEIIESHLIGGVPVKRLIVDDERWRAEKKRVKK